MAGDLHVNERAVVEAGGTRAAEAAGAAEGAERSIHRYGRVNILASRDGAAEVAAGAPAVPEGLAVEGLDATERLGLEALRLRSSDGYGRVKSRRPRAGEPWDFRGCTREPPPGARRTPPATRLAQRPETGAGEAQAEAEWTPTSEYLEDSVAVGLVIVEGPDAALKFTDAERLKIVAEVQNGLGWFAGASPLAGISFTYDIQVVTLDVPADPNAQDLEALWLDPAMVALGYDPGWAGVDQYVRDIRTKFGTRWTFGGFFTRYPLSWFAYAYLGGPYLVMDYDLDGWGVENMDRVFAHETGHVFNCPDEYGSSGCSCGGAWGRFRLPNGNCENCAPGGGVPCLMKANEFTVCEYTRGHIGWGVTAPMFVRHSGKVLDVEGAATTGGAPLIQYDWWGGDNQRWRLEAVGGGYVRAVAVHSGKVLDVEGAATGEGAPVIQYDWWGGDNQRWRYEPIGYAGDVRLTAKHSGKALDVDDSSDANGARAVQRTWIKRHSQHWGSAFHPLMAKHSGKVVSGTNLGGETGAPVVQCEYFAGDQRWWLQPKGDGYVLITAMETGLVLDVEAQSTADGARVILWWETGGDNQLFRPEEVEPGVVRLVARHSGKVIAVAGRSTADGAGIIQATWDGGDNQRWRV